MDWTTGLWYKFDDDKVTLLKDGPDYMFDVMAQSGSNVNNAAREHVMRSNKVTSNQRLKQGCTSTTSLLYVERSYLGHYAAMQIQSCTSGNDTDIYHWIQEKRNSHEQSVQK